ncbi:MAG TPA: hypothetical protein VN887_19135 [Candidatus Angelobacter sp.]|nr:hypothetical protein [Candidatus Angelobacter sp.]
MKTRILTFPVAVAVIMVPMAVFSVHSEPVRASNDTGAGAAAEEAKTPDAGTSSTTQGPQAGMKMAAPTSKFSFGVDEIAKMSQGGVETDVILNYIENSNVPYHPNADEVVRLHDLGVPPQIITALIRHGAKVQQQAAAAYAQNQQRTTEEAKAAAATGNTNSAPVYTAPAVTYNYVYPDYAYGSYPVYTYPAFYSYPRYCYSSPFYFGFRYPCYRPFYSFSGFHTYSRFGFGGRAGFGGRVGFGRLGLGGGFHGGRHR